MTDNRKKLDQSTKEWESEVERQAVIFVESGMSPLEAWDMAMAFVNARRASSAAKKIEHCKIKYDNDMDTISTQGLMADTVLWFCENAAELGCPRDKDVDMWFRELSDSERENVMSKLLDIQERYEESKKSEDDSEDIVMKKIKLDLDQDIIDHVIKTARSQIVNDDQALLEYGVNYILMEIIESKKLTDYPDDYPENEI